MLVQSQIENLVRFRLMGRKVDAVGFVDDLLELSHEVGEIRCAPIGQDRLVFSISRQPPDLEVDLERAVGKIRMLCARLAVLCNESGNQDVSPYGDEGVIVKANVPALVHAVANDEPSSNGSGYPQRQAGLSWKVRFQNTMFTQEFTIQAN